jgi:hypothetical protein
MSAHHKRAVTTGDRPRRMSSNNNLGECGLAGFHLTILEKLLTII